MMGMYANIYLGVGGGGGGGYVVLGNFAERSSASATYVKFLYSVSFSTL